MNKPLVSILVPVYGVETFIKKCAISLFEQDYPNLEFIFVDDCTPDNSIGIMLSLGEHYPNRKNHIKVIKHNTNQGLSEARNTAVDNACGQYIMHVDSDDYIERSTVSKCVDMMQRASADVVVFGMRHMFRNKYVDEINRIPEKKDDYVKQLLRRETAVCVCGALYKKELYTKYGIRAIKGLNFGEDYAVKPRLIYNARKVVGLNEPLYYYVHYNEGSYTKNFSRKNIVAQSTALNVLSDYFKDKGELFEESLRVAKIRVKAELLIGWGIGNGTVEDLNYLNDSFEDEDYIIKSLSTQYRIAILLQNNAFLLRLYSKIGVFIKQLLK